MDVLAETMARLDGSHSAYHAISLIENDLKNAGFAEIFEQNPFQLEKGKGYYLKRNGSTILAFFVPSEEFKGFRIAASHSDSPSFKLKHNPLVFSAGYNELRVEPYGGMIMSTWFDRPLSVAGRVMVEKDGEIEERLFDIDEDLAVIPNQCIHFSRDINDGHKFDPNTELIPLLGAMGEKFSWESYLQRKANLGEGETIVDEDLFLYVREKARRVGLEGEFLLSPRLDNLTSAFTSTFALLQSSPKDGMPVMVVFDNEEVGSSSRQGAAGDLLKSTLDRICTSLGKNKEESYANSFLLSIDNAHARHPNYPGNFEPSCQVRLNEGVVLKYNASLRYTSDGYSASVVRTLAKKANVSIQTFSNRPDIRGGSTLGNIALSSLSISAADIGLAQLAMHSSVETMGAYDLLAMKELVREFYSSSILFMGDRVRIED